ncbi:MAG: ribbon-helix-helix protein, CopG family [Deltaproteobacteria bacterium]|nr:ribbon-helix-helix protein, CopG family [Deltaproteobacteria bacterium]
MRTTLTLEKDVAESIKRLLKRRGTSMKALINEALRLGLSQIERPGPKKAFCTKVVSLKPDDSGRREPSHLRARQGVR